MFNAARTSLIYGRLAVAAQEGILNDFFPINTVGTELGFDLQDSDQGTASWLVDLQRTYTGSSQAWVRSLLEGEDSD